MEEAAVKPRVRVKAGRSAGYMRDSQSGVIAARPASLREHRDDVRRSWWRAAGLAMDLLQNSGRLRGVADQIIADTVGVELTLNPQPDLTRFGYDQKEAIDWIRLVKARFKVWAWNASECDFRGKFTLPQQTDIGIRNWLAFGESLGVVSYMPRAQRERYGIRTGTKFLLFSPTKLVQDTNEVEGLYQGIIHDANGRPSHYRFQEREAGIIVKRDYAARDADGRQLVMHAFDPFSAEDVRGITVLASTFRKYLMGENLDDATAQMAFLQTIYAAVLTSDRPSADAFEALSALKDSGIEGGDEVAKDFVNYFSAHLDRAAESEIRMGAGPGVSHLAPGEKLSIETAKVPGKDYLPFAAALQRETARALGVTFGGYTLDYTTATYASTMMETASVWPIATRRTDRIAAPHVLVPYASWLDEMIGEGEIPFKGGVEAYQANRDSVLWALCLGPSKPTADDEKAAKASTERILNGTSSIDVEASANGQDAEEIFESNMRWHQRYADAGMPSPFVRKTGSEPAKKDDASTKEKT
ncbi:phage portal protein [Rhizobiaceae bacterium n13]|uniref:phage portal protein n=1 Tax=Ferirhizobium litorale TaxID=2927786 RepID=UPI0024B307D7|nr:phage portal protein [Fererhizobium litorale]MDI7864309.1 phage portal protein [Fererhizobium litorale]